MAQFMEDEKIIELYFARSEQAIKECDKKYGNYCYKIAWNILSNNEDCQECVNDTWLHAWSAIPPQKPDRLSVYLGKITRNLALNIYQKSHRKKRKGVQADIVFDELEEVISGVQTPEESVEMEFLTECINTYLDTLPQLNRLVFTGRYWRLENVEQISSHLGISRSKTKSLLFRTRNGLREFLEKEGIFI